MLWSVDNGWNEGAITWNNAPALAGSALDSVSSVGDEVWVEYDVTAAVSGNGTFSFALQNSSTNSLYFNSRQATAYQPQLVVEASGAWLARPGGPQ